MAKPLARSRLPCDRSMQGLVPEDDGLLKGALNEIVYFGTDTHFHVALDDGTAFVLRQQNSPDVESSYSQGDRVGITLCATMSPRF